jgi:hypothetical protein
MGEIEVAGGPGLRLATLPQPVGARFCFHSLRTATKKRNEQSGTKKQRAIGAVALK